MDSCAAFMVSALRAVEVASRAEIAADWRERQSVIMDGSSWGPGWEAVEGEGL